MNFDKAFDRLMVFEGGFVEHENDPGGATKWGVTASVAREWGYPRHVSELSLIEAKRIYQAAYWNAVRAEEVPAALRYSLFDAAVNSGVRQAIGWLQATLEVEVDGDFGPLTMKALNEKDPIAVAAALNGRRLDMLTNLHHWATFGKGWARRIASVMRCIERDSDES